MFTPLRLLSYAPNCTSAAAQSMSSVLEAKRVQYGLTTPLRCQLFMGQTFVESQGFTHNFENLNYSAAAIAASWPRLAPRADALARNPEAIANAAYAAWTDSSGVVHDQLGNGPEGNGNGWLYRGRGIMQLTGAANYISMRSVLGIDLVANPDLAADWGTASEIAMYFWKQRNCNTFADKGDVQGVTRLINGGITDLASRVSATNAAMKVFV